MEELEILLRYSYIIWADRRYYLITVSSAPRTVPYIQYPWINVPWINDPLASEWIQFSGGDVVLIFCTQPRIPCEMIQNYNSFVGKKWFWKNSALIVLVMAKRDSSCCQPHLIQCHKSFEWLLFLSHIPSIQTQVQYVTKSFVSLWNTSWI